MNHKLVKFVGLVVLALVLVACSSAGGDLTVEDVWARPGLANGNTAVYFLVNNPNSTGDRLLEARGGVSEKVELHMSSMGEDGVMKMDMQPDVPIPANGTVKFERGGLHVMLINLDAPLEVGDAFELILVFEGAGEIKLEVPVEER